MLRAYLNTSSLEKRSKWHPIFRCKCIWGIIRKMDDGAVNTIFPSLHNSRMPWFMNFLVLPLRSWLANVVSVCLISTFTKVQTRKFVNFLLSSPGTSVTARWNDHLSPRFQRDRNYQKLFWLPLWSVWRCHLVGIFNRNKMLLKQTFVKGRGLLPKNKLLRTPIRVNPWNG